MGDMGHQGGGHHGHMHAGHGGDGMGVTQSLGITQGQQHHGFLSHLLGLDHDSHGHHGHQGHAQQQGVPTDKTPQGSPSWSSPLQAVKLSDVFQGINITPNVMFLMLFGGFAAWLGVIYMVRHHEPMANQVLGSGGGYSSTAQADRQLVAGMRWAVPIRTGSSTGAVYIPNNSSEPQMASPGAYAASPPAQSGLPQPGYAAPVAAQPAMDSMSGMGQPGQMAPPQPEAPMAGSAMSSYIVPIRTAEGLRVKTITNR